MDLIHTKAEFNAGRVRDAAAEPSDLGEGWRQPTKPDENASITALIMPLR